MGEKKSTYNKKFKLDAIRMYLSGEHGGYTPVARQSNFKKILLNTLLSCVNITILYQF